MKTKTKNTKTKNTKTEIEIKNQGMIIRPSDAINNEDLHRQLADDSNRRRQERQDKIRLETLFETIEDITRDDRLKDLYENHIKEEKKESKPIFGLGKKIKVYLDGIEMDNLSHCMSVIEPKLFGKRNDFRDSEWNKLNRKLKKEGSTEYRGHTIKLR